MFGGRGDILASDLTDVRSRGDAGRIARQMDSPFQRVAARLKSGAVIETTAPLSLSRDDGSHFLE